MVVKAIGCPEVHSIWQLVAEIVGNATARRLGVLVPEPAIINISPSVADLMNASIRNHGYSFEVQAGPATGCEYMRGLVNYTPGQQMSSELREQAERVFVFDMLSQNSDRRPGKANCALSSQGLVAFDFELCFAHKFLPIIGASDVVPYEPSKVGISRGHIFYDLVANKLPDRELVEAMASSLTLDWWTKLLKSLPPSWQPDASKIGDDLMTIGKHSSEFAKDLLNRCFL